MRTSLRPAKLCKVGRVREWAELAALLGCITGLSTTLESQTSNGPRPYRAAFGAGIGISEYDLDGNGTALVGLAFLRFQPFRAFGLQLSVPYWRDFREVLEVGGITHSVTTSYLLPEVSVVVSAPGDVQPYLGAGGGVNLPQKNGLRSSGTLHALAGLRVRIGAQRHLFFEGRLRSIRPWSGSTADLLLGFENRR